MVVNDGIMVGDLTMCQLDKLLITRKSLYLGVRDLQTHEAVMLAFVLCPTISDKLQPRTGHLASVSFGLK